MKKIIFVIILIILFYSPALSQDIIQSIQSTTKTITLSNLGSWQLNVPYGNAGIDGELLKANTTDSAAQITLTNPAVSSNTVAVTLEYDGFLDYSVWGQGTYVYARMNNDNRYKIVSKMNDCCTNSNLHEIQYWTNSGVNVSYTKEFVVGLYYHKVLFLENEITVTVEDSDGFTIFQKTTEVPGLQPKEFYQIAFGLNTTSNNPAWMKNLSVTVMNEI